jgi:methionyl-tRNA synthetase
MSDTFYVTTPIYYVNARPHIGHAYTTIVADVLARRHRLLGEDTFFLTGTDEHGQKIERSAAAAGIPPQQFANQVSKSFQDLWKRMGILRDTGDPLYQQDYIRTTDPRHTQGVQKLFTDLYNNGFIYLASYTGAYCVSDEAFVDAPVGTPCPDCGRLLEEVTEENFFFKLSAFQRPLLDLIESNTIAITPESRKNEVLSFLRGNTNTTSVNTAISATTTDLSSRPEAEGRSGEIPAFEAATTARTAAGHPYVPGALKDLSISRSSFTWGVPVPEPAASVAAQKHVIYVWLDALANYITALGYGSDNEALFKKFWPADLHLVGKEIIRFHCVYWPAFLLALNPAFRTASDLSSRPEAERTLSQNLSSRPEAEGRSGETRSSAPPQLSFEQHKAWAKDWLPKAITAHGWLLFEDSKMSKSKGNIVRTETILDAFGTLCPSPASPPANSADRVPQGFSLGSHSDEKNGGALAPEVRLASQADRDLFASDVLRYFLLREIPFGQDGSFSFDALITRYNADLANGYGNLVSRTLAMIDKYFASTVPECLETEAGSFYLAPRKESFLRPEQRETLGASEGQILGWHLIRIAEKVEDLIASNSFDQAIAAISSGVTLVDQFITSRKPWAATDTEISQNGRRSTLYTAAESIRIITALLYPILPYATARVWAQLGLGDIELAARNGELKNLEWGGLKPNTKLGPLGPIFPRADKGLANIMTDMENPTPVDATPTDPAAVTHTPTSDPAAGPRTTTLPEPTGTLPVGGSTALTTGPADTPSHAQTQASGIFVQQPPAPLTTDNGERTTPQITIDDFAKIELRVAQILVAERIPKADKLLRLEVDLGPDFPRRQILSGIAEWYTPEDLIGRRIVVITNLAPRKMRGLESHGMLLAASHGEGGKPVLATFGEDIALGSRLK